MTGTQMQELRDIEDKQKELLRQLMELYLRESQIKKDMAKGRKGLVSRSTISRIRESLKKKAKQ